MYWIQKVTKKLVKNSKNDDEKHMEAKYSVNAKKGGEVGLECNFIRIQVGQIPTNHDSHSPQLMS